MLVLAGDHIYKMDYGPFIQQHRRKRADVTIAVKPVPIEEAHRFGVLALDDNDAVTEWQEKPRHPHSDLASLGIYVFSRKALEKWLGEGRNDFGRNIIPAMLEAGSRVYGYRFEDYWQDVGTVHSYWETQMELLDDHPPLDLYDRDWVVHTRSEERAPARIGPTANVHRSLISHGCQIAGTVERSVLSPGVRVDPGAIVRDSVIMFDTHIRAGAVVDRAIIDKEVSVGPNAIVGTGVDMKKPNEDEPERLNTGITVVGKRAVIPASARIGRNVRIAGRCPARPTSSPSASRAVGASSARRPQSHGARRPDRGSRPGASRRLLRPSTVGSMSSAWNRSIVVSATASSSWDLRLDGRRRPDIRVTLILDPESAMLFWVHFAPPLNDSFRVSYRQFLRWNDELPFVKFALSEDDRPMLTAEVDRPPTRHGRPGPGHLPPAGRV